MIAILEKLEDMFDNWHEKGYLIYAIIIGVLLILWVIFKK